MTEPTPQHAPAPSPASHLWRAVRFVLGLLALVIVIDQTAGLVLDRWFRDSRAGETAGRVNLYLEAAADADVLIFGSSRARHHYDPAVIAPLLGDRSTFNLGASGQAIPYSRVLQRLLFARGARPSCIVMHLDLNSLYFNAHARVAVLRPYAGEDPEADAILRDQIAWFDLKKHFALWRYNSISAALFVNRGQRDVIDSGFESLRVRMNVLQLPDEVGWNLAPLDPPKPPDAQALRYLHRMITDALAHDVRVVMLTGPRYDRHPDGTMLFNPHRERMRELLTGLAQEWNVRYFDIHERDVPTLLAPELWYDDGHLNAQGATTFSRLAAPLIAEGCNLNQQAGTAPAPGSASSPP